MHSESFEYLIEFAQIYLGYEVKESVYTSC